MHKYAQSMQKYANFSYAFICILYARNMQKNMQDM